MKIRIKILLILIINSLTLGLLCGCGDVFNNLSAVISENEITYDLEGENTFTVSLSGLDEKYSADISFNMDNPNIVKLEKQVDEIKDEVTFTVSPISVDSKGNITAGGSTTISLIHTDSNKLLGSVKVNVVIKAKSISQSSYKPYVVVSEDGSEKMALNTTNVINFNPANTTQKKVVYSISNEDIEDGITITKEGVITATKYPSKGYIDVTANVVEGETYLDVSTKVRVAVLKPILREDIVIKNNITKEIISEESLITLVNNRENESSLEFTIESNYQGGREIELESTVSNTLLLDEPYLISQSENLYLTKTGYASGQTTLNIIAKIVGFESYFKEIKIPVKVIEVPDYLSINGDYSVIQYYDIYDNNTKNSGLGDYFKVNVGNVTANNTNFIIELESQYSSLIDVYYGLNMEKVPTVTDYTLATENDIVLSDGFYIKSKSVNFNTQVILKVYAFGGVGYSDVKCITLALTIRKGVSKLSIDTNDNYDYLTETYYLEKGKSMLLNFSTDSIFAYSREYALSSTVNGIVSFENDIISGEEGKSNYTAKLIGLEQGYTTITITSSNGIKESIDVRVYEELSYFSIYTDSFVSNDNIGMVEYADSEQLDENGNNVDIQTLSVVALKVGAILPTYLNKYTKDRIVNNNADIFSISYKFANAGDSKYISITQEGVIYARRTTPWNETDSDYQSVKIICEIKYYTQNGIKTHQIKNISKLSFDIIVYKSIDSVSVIGSQKLTLYYSSEPLYYYYDEYQQKEVQFTIEGNATHYTITPWTESGLHDESKLLNLDYNDETRSCLVTTKNEVTDGVTSISMQVRQFNKVYVKQIKFNVVKINEIEGIRNVSYKYGNDNNQQSLSSNGDNIEITAEQQSRFLGKISLDNRDINIADNISLVYSLKNDATFRGLVIAYVKNGKLNYIDSNQFSIKDINASGVTYFFFIPNTAFTSTNEYPNKLLSANIDNNALDTLKRSYDFFYVFIADGLTENTAFEVKTPNDLIRINNEESLQSYKYYKLISNINLSGISNWTPIGSSNNLNGFRGYFNGNGFTIKGLKINTTLVSNVENVYYGLFGKITSSTSKIFNLNLQVESVSISITKDCYNQELYFGALAGYVDGEVYGVNVEINKSTINLNDVPDISYFYIGGIVGYNKGTIDKYSFLLTNNNGTEITNIDNYVSGNMDIVIENNDRTIQNIYAGGFTGFNNGTITGTYAHKTGENINYEFLKQNKYNSNICLSYKKDNVSAKTINTYFGGIAGQNSGTIQNVVVNPKIFGKQGNVGANNVGGIAGQNNSNSKIENCNVILTNSKISSNEYGYALSGNENVGSIAGISNGTITQVYALLLDVTDYYTFSGTINPLIIGNNNVGGLIGKADNGCSISQSYVYSYFDRSLGNSTENVNYLGNIALYNNNGSKLGALIGSVESITISQCFAIIDIYSQFTSDANSYNRFAETKTATNDLYSIINSNVTFTDWNANDTNSQIVDKFKNVVALFEKPTGITAVVKTDSAIHKKVNDTSAILFYSTNEDNNFISIFDLLTIMVMPETANLYNIFSNNDNIVTYNGTNLIIKSTGEVSISVTSLLNNKLKTEIKLIIIDEFSDDFGVYKDVGLSDENLITSIDLQVEESKDIFIKVETENGENYFVKDGTTYKYSAENLYYEFEKIDSNLLTINGKDLIGQNLIISSDEKLSIIANSESGSVNLTINLVAEVGDIYVILKTATLNVTIFKGVEAIKFSSNKASISSKDVYDLNIFIESDFASNSDFDEFYNLDFSITDINDNDKYENTEYSYTSMFLGLETEYIGVSNGNLNYKISFEINKDSDLYRSFVNNRENLDLFVYINITDKGGEIQLTKTFNLTINIQYVENISLDFYAYSQQVKTLDTSTNTMKNQFTINEVSTNGIVSGTKGILKVNIYPEYAQIDEIEVTYETADNQYLMTIEQMLLIKTLDGMNKVYTNLVPRPQDIINGIRIKNLYTTGYYDENDILKPNELNFDGVLYIGLTIGGGVPAGVDFKINVKITTKSNESDKSAIVVKKDIVLTSVERSAMTLVYNDTPKEDIAIETDHVVTLSFNKLIDDEKELDKVKFVLKYEDNTGKLAEIPNFNNILEVERLNIIQTYDKSYDVEYKIIFLSGATINRTYVIDAQLEKVVNKQTTYYSCDEVVRLTVRKAVIKGIKVEGLTGNDLRLAIGQNIVLKATIEMSYNEDVYTGYETFNQTISQTITNWYKGSVLTNLSGEVLDNNYYRITKLVEGDNKDYYQITGLRKQENTLTLGFGFAYKYNYNGTPNLVSKIETDNINVFGDTTDLGTLYIEKTTFNLDIYDSGTIENAVPISTYKDLLNMYEGDYSYYRLTNDIYVDEPFTPINKDIRYLDGNGYSIYLLKGFSSDIVDLDLESYSETSLNIGLFETLNENMRVYSLTMVLPQKLIEVPYEKTIEETENEEEQSNIEYKSNDFSGYDYSEINISSIAGINNGTIYNCNSLTKSFSYSLDNTDGIYIKVDEEYRLYDSLSDEEKEGQENNTDRYSLNVSDLESDKIVDIKTNVATTLSVGGIAAINDNTGYIANSRSSAAIFVNRGNVGGFVAGNRGVIATSYYKSPNVDGNVSISNATLIDEMSSIGGFVANNSGTIRYSYVEGCGSKLEDKFTDGYIKASINVGAFVYSNTKEIYDCYANIPVSGTSATSGFVFTNSGAIDNCYSASKLTEKNSEFTPFVGTQKAGSTILNTGTITNCYYLERKNNSFFAPTLKQVEGVKAFNLVSSKIMIDNEEKTTFDNFIFNYADKKNGIWKFSTETDSSYITLQDANDIKEFKAILASSDTEENENGEFETIYVWTMNNDCAYVISSVEDFNGYFEIESDYIDNNNKYNAETVDTFVIVRDIEFSKTKYPIDSPKITFGGKILGNGMTLSGLAITNTTGSLESVENFGLFAKIEKDSKNNNSLIKDLNLKIDMLTANNAKNVGGLAGTISNTTLTNISLDSSNAVIQGINLVGGLIGVVKKSCLVNYISATAKINASYADNNSINNNALYNKNDKNYTYSYVGVIAGLVEDDSASILENILVYGEDKLKGYYIGTIVGYLGENAKLNNSNVILDETSYILATRIAGGIVGYNKGNIDNCTIDTSFEDNESFNYYKGSPTIIGGIVGINENNEDYSNKSKIDTVQGTGIIRNVENYINVSNLNSTIAGGVVGVSLGGAIGNCKVEGLIETRIDGIMGSVIGAMSNYNAIKGSYFINHYKNKTDNGADKTIIYLTGMDIKNASCSYEDTGKYYIGSIQTAFTCDYELKDETNKKYGYAGVSNSIATLQNVAEYEYFILGTDKSDTVSGNAS